MKYLFFDIECSDGYHICSFGYVLVDEKMKIVEKNDIVMNPESKFILAPKKSRPRIQLAYSEEYFYKHGNFASQYDDIKKILSRKNQIIFGHSIASDFRFLIYACQRYNLPSLALEGYDTQKIYQIFSNTSHVESLEKIVDELNIQTDFQYNKSSDDAHATFLIAKRMCKKDGISFNEFIKKYHDCLVTTADFNNKPIKERFSDKLEKLKEKYASIKKNGCIAFSEVLNTLKNDQRIYVIEKIYEKGYNFSTKIKECSIFVKGEGESERQKYCEELSRAGKRIKIISLDEFIKIIDLKDNFLG